MRPPSGREWAIGGALAVVLLLVGVVAIAWWETDGSWQPIDVDSYRVEADGTRLLVWGGCWPALRATTVTETDEQVTVLLEVRGDHTGNDCMRGDSTALAAPLGDRVVVDVVDGEPMQAD